MTVEQWHVRQRPANKERVDREEEEEVSRVSNRRTRACTPDDGARLGDGGRHESGPCNTGQKLRPRRLLHCGMFKKLRGLRIPNNCGSNASYLCRIVCAM